MISRAMGAIKPGSQERDISVKTIVQGRPDVSAYTCGSFPVLFLMHGGRGCGGHPAFPAPSDFGGTDFLAKLGRIGAARTRHDVFSAVMPRFKRGIQHSRDSHA
jgi:hypothetical protein